tara:strand:+ start:30 stop:449 length:420 start_codon:yes stop_codon:yes gene_type:complete
MWRKIMGFKLGGGRKAIARAGVLNKKLSFKSDEGSVPGHEVIRKPLGADILGEANMDGTIFVSDKVVPGSPEDKQILLHEMRHSVDMLTGKLSYGDDFVQFNGVTYPRETRNGKDMIKVDGQWKEAGDDFPWEREANRL